MRQALYRNYRPRSFKELLGQEHVTSTLQKAVESGRISHAYLFTGPRGVGKTSAARILAYEVNKFPYDGESPQLDIIEIDAASNRRIDEIRDLRDKVRIAPAVGTYKVYIIDEVHMLTREAFNALLKTLEEPPAHAIFILATTEAHKLPDTIVSRTQRFEFKPVTPSLMASHLKNIAKHEKIDIDEPALYLLAQFGGGSFRDSISLLDQLSGHGAPITEKEVRLSLGLPSEKALSSLLDAVFSGDQPAVLEQVQSLKEQGIDAAAFAAGISALIRRRLIDGSSPATAIGLLKQLIDVPASPKPYDYLEICLLDAASAANVSLPAVTVDVNKPKKQATAAIESAKKIDEPAKKSIVKFDISVWPAVVDSAKQRAASIYTALRLAQPEINGDGLLLKFEFPLHQKKIDLAKNKEIVAALIEQLTGQLVNVSCAVDKSAFSARNIEVKAAKEDTPIHSISNIFGNAEVVEA